MELPDWGLMKVFLHRIIGLRYYLRLFTGELAEWLKAAVLKTAVG
jgi:hypothetical protein|tara:strand:- start:238 stop:372 length:135 start_codon:yes stop_codon:yes gene_type:complete